MISIIAAMAKNRVIGNKGTVPWHISEDFIYFNKVTTGHPIIMGRKTHESISGFENHIGWKSEAGSQKPIHKLLPNRTNIVVTRQQDYEIPGGVVVDSIEKAIEKAKQSEGSDEIFIVGGAELYKETIKLANKLYLTVIDEEVEGDVSFPEFENEFTLAEEKKRTVRVNDKEIRYSFRVYNKN